MAMDPDYCDRDTNIIMQAEEHDLPHAEAQEQLSTTTSPLPENQTLPIHNSSEPHTPVSEDVPDDETFSSDHHFLPEVVLDSASGVSFSHDPKVKNKIYYKPIPADILQKLSVLHWWRPLQDKLDKLKQVLAHTKHPNYGGVQFLSPQEIWEKFHEKGHDFLTGINGAVFGLANVANHDYPFAYRRLESEKVEKQS